MKNYDINAFATAFFPEAFSLAPGHDETILPDRIDPDAVGHREATYRALQRTEKALEHLSETGSNLVDRGVVFEEMERYLDDAVQMLRTLIGRAKNGKVTVSESALEEIVEQVSGAPHRLLAA